MEDKMHYSFEHDFVPDKHEIPLNINEQQRKSYEMRSHRTVVCGADEVDCVV